MQLQGEKGKLITCLQIQCTLLFHQLKITLKLAVYAFQPVDLDWELRSGCACQCLQRRCTNCHDQQRSSSTHRCCAVAEEHACIEVKRGRLYCSPLVGDPDNFRDETRTWFNDSEMRSGAALHPSCDVVTVPCVCRWAVKSCRKTNADICECYLLQAVHIY